MKPNEAGLFEVIIDDKKYEFAKWGAEDATDTLLDLAAIVGKPLGLGLAALTGKDEEGKSGLDKKIDPNIIGSVMEALSQNVGSNKATIKALIKKLSSDQVFCDGAKINFNLHYQDKTLHMFKVVRAALEVQYGNFFAALQGFGGILKPQGLTNRGPQT